jgi:ubiquitin-activating enzyme E1
MSKKINLESVLEEDGDTGSAGSAGVTSEDIANILQRLPDIATLQKLKLQELEFEKDDDLHMGFITVASNVRAANYGIPTASKLETKLIAGRIIPAIATTTSVIAGIVALEVLKLAGERPLAAFKNCFIGLAAPSISFAKPLKPLEYTCNGRVFNEWDRIEVKQGSLTVQEFVSFFRKEFDWELSAVFWKEFMVYFAYDIVEEELNSKIEEVTLRFQKNESDVGPKVIPFTITVQNSTSEGIRFPPVYYYYE